MSKGRALVLAIGGLVLLITSAAVIGLRGRGYPEPTVPFDQVIEDGVVFVEEHDLYVVWDDGELLALSADAQHIGDDVLFCRSSGLFESPAHGEKFDRRGYYYGGPARRGLDRYPVRVEGNGVYVDVGHPMPGPPRKAGPAQEPIGRFCAGFSSLGAGGAGFYDLGSRNRDHQP